MTHPGASRSDPLSQASWSMAISDVASSRGGHVITRSATCQAKAQKDLRGRDSGPRPHHRSSIGMSQSACLRWHSWVLGRLHRHYSPRRALSSMVYRAITVNSVLSGRKASDISWHAGHVCTQKSAGRSPLLQDHGHTLREEPLGDFCGKKTLQLHLRPAPICRECRRPSLTCFESDVKALEPTLLERLPEHVGHIAVHELAGWRLPLKTGFRKDHWVAQG